MSGSVIVCGHEIVVGEDHISPDQLRRVDGLEAFDRRGLAVGVLRGGVFKNEKMDESGRIVLLLPCDVPPSSGFVASHVMDKFFDRLLDLGDRTRVHLILSDLVDSHAISVLVCAQAGGTKGTPAPFSHSSFRLLR